MPELPSLEIFKQYFDSTSLNQEIKEINIHNPEILFDISENNIKELLNRYFVSSSRYGKYLFASSSDNRFLSFSFWYDWFF